MTVDHLNWENATEFGLGEKKRKNKKEKKKVAFNDETERCRPGGMTASGELVGFKSR